MNQTILSPDGRNIEIRTQPSVLALNFLRETNVLTTCKPRNVKECFALANALKSGPFDLGSFRRRLAEERTRIASLSADQLDSEVTDDARLARYNEGKWRLAVVDLQACSVWERMGGRKWATGPVPRVVAELQKNPDKKLDEMKDTVQRTFADVPLIVFRRKRSADQFRIDDGCHRAVAYYRAGFRQAFAYVGEYQGVHEVYWKWEGL